MLLGGQKSENLKISPPVTSPPEKKLKFQGCFSKTTFLVHKAHLFGFMEIKCFGGKIGFFRFLGFFEKNLKPKKFVLGVKNEKNEKSKCVFWKRMKSLRKESVLIF